MERGSECKMCDAIISIERRVVALEEAAKVNKGSKSAHRTTQAIRQPEEPASACARERYKK